MKKYMILILTLALYSCEERSYREHHNAQVEQWEDSTLKNEKKNIPLKPE